MADASGFAELLHKVQRESHSWGGHQLLIQKQLVHVTRASFPLDVRKQVHDLSA